MLCSARRWRIGGRVQGVGFRPFVYRLALEQGLTGWVQNRLGEVLIHSEGEPAAQECFGQALVQRAPPLAEPRILSVEAVSPIPADRFRIELSAADGPAAIHVPPDFFTCDDCLAELSDPADRRYRYPFINCTQCGPRYTLIRALPYDRANTSMAGFPLCADCRREYEDPGDRRFHAEPVACPVCGPGLTFMVEDGQPTTGNEAALQACIAALRAGRIVAVKGIGGYHLMCDACDDGAVVRLRKRKRRPDKPLAVMFPAPAKEPLGPLLEELLLDPVEEALLRSPMRPVVLARKRPGGRLSVGIAPGLAEIGAMLPYSPLHHLLLTDFGGPLVATSGNLSGEPVLTDPPAVGRRLRHVANAFLHHDRPIERPADDPVYRRIGGCFRPLRLGRGCAPLELALPRRLTQPVIATGGHMKNTLALAWADRVVVSPHIGDMGSRRGLEVFEQLATDLQSLYGVTAQALVCDAHPGYATTHWARTSGLPVTRVGHHAAHASAVAGEFEPQRDWLVFTWDGVGLGDDGTLWGGEALAGRPGQWQRVGSMRPFRLLGGERAGREPWRSAAALCWEIGRDWQPPGCDEQELALLHHAWGRGLNAPVSSAVGRLFDAASALTGVCTQASFEGQGPMQLEAICRGPGEVVELPLSRGPDGVYRSDWQPLIEALLDRSTDPATGAACFHHSLAAALVQQARRIREQRSIDCIGLSGGVFQNRVLCEQVIGSLEAEGFKVFLNQRLPMNDGGLCFGQVIEFAAS